MRDITSIMERAGKRCDIKQKPSNESAKPVQRKDGRSRSSKVFWRHVGHGEKVTFGARRRARLNVGAGI